MNADDIKRLQAHEYHNVDAMNPEPPETVWRDGAKDERLDILSMFHVSDDEMTVVSAEVSEDRKTVLLEWNGEIEITLTLQDVEALAACLVRAEKIMKGGV